MAQGRAKLRQRDLTGFPDTESVRTCSPRYEHLGRLWIETGRRRIYLAEDSGDSPDLADLRARLGSPDFALLPIGAYKPRWLMNGAHIAPDDALIAHCDRGARASLGMHCDTFPLPDQTFGYAERLLAEVREKSGVTSQRFQAPATGEAVVIG